MTSPCDGIGFCIPLASPRPAPDMGKFVFSKQSLSRVGGLDPRFCRHGGTAAREGRVGGQVHVRLSTPPVGLAFLLSLSVKERPLPFLPGPAPHCCFCPLI